MLPTPLDKKKTMLMKKRFQYSEDKNTETQSHTWKNSASAQKEQEKEDKASRGFLSKVSMEIKEEDDLSRLSKISLEGGEEDNHSIFSQAEEENQQSNSQESEEMEDESITSP